jgi:hypothetical protein
MSDGVLTAVLVITMSTKLVIRVVVLPHTHAKAVKVHCHDRTFQFFCSPFLVVPIGVKDLRKNRSVIYDQFPLLI